MWSKLAPPPSPPSSFLIFRLVLKTRSTFKVSEQKEEELMVLLILFSLFGVTLVKGGKSQTHTHTHT